VQHAQHSERVLADVTEPRHVLKLLYAAKLMPRHVLKLLYAAKLMPRHATKLSKFQIAWLLQIRYRC